MEEKQIKDMLNELKSKKISVNQAYEKLKVLPYEDIGIAKIDHHRQLRIGFPEIILCRGKEPQQVVKIIKKMLDHNDVLATKADNKVMKVQ
jgi:pyridinium-3,5-biscarboxylic acid mononucleotide synthase